MKSYRYDKTYDVIVIGAGHAGCEAALACARLQLSTLVLTQDLDTIAKMSCNPAIGGLAKGHLVREIDALGGEMGLNIDATAIHYRTLNMRKGPAVRGTRAQADKKLYQNRMKYVLEREEHLDLKQALVEELLTEETPGGNRQIVGVRTQTGMVFEAGFVIVTTGTFLKGLIHLGDVSFEGGRTGEKGANGLSVSLERIGIELQRLKTGTPCRVAQNSLDFSKMEIQPAEKNAPLFSFRSTRAGLPQLPCYITYTNQKTHEIILNNLDRAPLYSGQIRGVGPRYCPSIEVKVVRFADKDRHQVFVEPEGLHTGEYYVNGMSTSLPQDIQVAMMRTIPGFEKVEIMRFGYAVEYDFAPPTQLWPWLETRRVRGLFLAGQINGTSGYEEAAAQGLMAGLNVVLQKQGRPPFILRRDEAYIGVLIDDLVTKGTEEPYRMFTSSAEYRLLLRQDNADLRLMHYGQDFGLIDAPTYARCEFKRQAIGQYLSLFRTKTFQGKPLDQLLRQPEMTLKRLATLFDESEVLSRIAPDVAEQLEIEIKYQGYMQRDLARAKRLEKFEKLEIPTELDIRAIKGLSNEAAEKLDRIRPASVGQARRIPGVSPCDISLLLVFLENRKTVAG
ncbi:MAG: tRNA uridine-5-carboxymethylaminomethyl(34) synthesis enzyme MnmG [Candidatus Omnitrophica bacterium]|nr:tRNA uridine-5-carboxymethylaminomethyl(34) synthesis enzyme MnmG [Candidatus Omnitrophota bacterium]